MKRFSLLLTLLFGCSVFFSQSNSNPFHDTQGNIEVNGSGQLQFSLPIALPPGIKSVAPQINLMYISGSSNGIAGYGWNLSGITSISREGKNLDKDGKAEGIQLNYEDIYRFNGQRLILKSGEYGKDGAEYVTEKYSNVKIKSIGALSGKNWLGRLPLKMVLRLGMEWGQVPKPQWNITLPNGKMHRATISAMSMFRRTMWR